MCRWSLALRLERRLRRRAGSAQAASRRVQQRLPTGKRGTTADAATGARMARHHINALLK